MSISQFASLLLKSLAMYRILISEFDRRPVGRYPSRLSINFTALELSVATGSG